MCSFQYWRWTDFRKLWFTRPGGSSAMGPGAHPQLWRRSRFSHHIWGVFWWSERFPPGTAQSTQKYSLKLQMTETKNEFIEEYFFSFVLFELSGSVSIVWWPVSQRNRWEWHCCVRYVILSSRSFAHHPGNLAVYLFSQHGSAEV